MPGKPFCLHKRGRYYYVQFKLPNNTWTNAKSTGEKTKGNAESWSINYLRSGQIVSRENVTFDDFTQGFFDWGGPWATDKQARGLRINRNHCLQRRDLLVNHLIPYLGTTRLTKITRDVIKDLRNHLFKAGYSGGTINSILSALKTILEAAEEQSLIQHIPKIDRAAVITKHRGILTVEEVQRLFRVEWWDYRGCIGSLLAASTGLRLGELQALTMADVHFAENYIHVRRSYCKRTRTLNETTKTGRARNIIIPQAVKDGIAQLVEINPWPINDATFIFFSTTTPEKPTEQLTFLKSLYRALNDIGIDDTERTRRNITFHSWRHWFNSLLLNARVPLQKIQNLTGHLTAEMSQHYYHLDDLSDVRAIQDSVFTAIEINGFDAESIKH